MCGGSYFFNFLLCAGVYVLAVLFATALHLCQFLCGSSGGSECGVCPLDHIFQPVHAGLQEAIRRIDVEVQTLPCRSEALQRSDQIICVCRCLFLGNVGAGDGFAHLFCFCGSFCQGHCLRCEHLAGELLILYDAEVRCSEILERLSESYDAGFELAVCLFLQIHDDAPEGSTGCAGIEACLCQLLQVSHQFLVVSTDSLCCCAALCDGFTQPSDITGTLLGCCREHVHIAGRILAVATHLIDGCAECLGGCCEVYTGGLGQCDGLLRDFLQGFTRFEQLGLLGTYEPECVCNLTGCEGGSAAQFDSVLFECFQVLACLAGEG